MTFNNKLTALILLVLGILAFVACEKTKDKLPLPEATPAYDEPNTNPNRFFDTAYIHQLEAIANTTFVEVLTSKAQDAAVEYHDAMYSVQDCFYDKILELNDEELYDLTEQMEIAEALFNDEEYMEEGLQMLSDIYTSLGCTTSHPITYGNKSYNIPIYDILQDFAEANTAKAQLMQETPGLNDLDENQLKDYLIIMCLHIDNNSAGRGIRQTPIEDCCGIYRATMSLLNENMHECFAVVDAWNLPPPATLAGYAGCAFGAGLQALSATGRYNDCVSGGGTAC